MKIKKLQEFKEMRRQRRIKVTPFINESVNVNYERLLKVDNDPNNKAAIILPNTVINDEQIANIIKDTIDEYVIENFLTEEVVDYEILPSLAESNPITAYHSRRSLCVLFSGMADTEILKDKAITLMSALDINHALLFTNDEQIGIDRFNEKKTRIKRLKIRYYDFAVIIHLVLPRYEADFFVPLRRNSLHSDL